MAVIPKECIISYANNTVIFSCDKTWSLAKKTAFKIFGACINSIPEDFSIKGNEQVIRRIEKKKYLALYCYCHLRWRKYLQHLLGRKR